MIYILDDALSWKKKWKDEGKDGYSKDTEKIEYYESSESREPNELDLEKPRPLLGGSNWYKLPAKRKGKRN